MESDTFLSFGIPNSSATYAGSTLVLKRYNGYFMFDLLEEIFIKIHGIKIEIGKYCLCQISEIKRSHLKFEKMEFSWTILVCPFDSPLN